MADIFLTNSCQYEGFLTTSAWTPAPVMKTPLLCLLLMVTSHQQLTETDFTVLMWRCIYHRLLGESEFLIRSCICYSWYLEWSKRLKTLNLVFQFWSCVLSLWLEMFLIWGKFFCWGVSCVAVTLAVLLQSSEKKVFSLENSHFSSQKINSIWRRVMLNDGGWK